MNKKKAKYFKDFDEDAKWLAAESEVTPETKSIAWGVDAMQFGTSISVGIHEKDKKGQLKISGLPEYVEQGKPSHDAMIIAREIQAMLGGTTGSYIISKGRDGQLRCKKTLITNRSRALLKGNFRNDSGSKIG